MHDWIKYSLLFLITALLQGLIFNQIQISIYINPLLYLAFVLLLPMRTPTIVVLICGLLMGVTMDLTMGLAGVNTIATLATAYFRIYLMKFIIGKDNITEGGMPAPNSIGYPKFFTYISVMTICHSLLFFGLEAMTWQYFGLTLLRCLLSSVITIGLVWLTAMFFSRRAYTI